jgi:hypothetical protein
LIIWDKLFGTFKAEETSLKPVYGVKRPVATWNPWLINFQHIVLLIKDAIRTKSIADKIKIWFMPTGWRPEDVKNKYPLREVESIHPEDKFNTPSSIALDIWIFFQFVITLILMLTFFNQIGEIASTLIILIGFFLFAQIFTYTSLMDRSNLTYVGWGIQTICLIAIVFLMTRDNYASFISEQWIIIPALYDIAVFAAAIYFLQIARFTYQKVTLVNE